MNLKNLKINYLLLFFIFPTYLFNNEVNEKEVRQKNILLATTFLNQNLLHKKREDLTLKDIYKLHKIVVTDLNHRPGKLRKINVEIKYFNLKFQHPDFVPKLMKEFIKWLNTAQGDPIKIAADAHLKLVQIHPFEDGNGRTARLLMNLILKQAGYNPITIPAHERKEYVHAVHEADVKKNFKPYYDYIFSKVTKK